MSSHTGRPEGTTEGFLLIPQFGLSCQNRDTDMKQNQTGSENTQRTKSAEVGRHGINPHSVQLTSTCFLKPPQQSAETDTRQTGSEGRWRKPKSFNLRQQQHSVPAPRKKKSQVTARARGGSPSAVSPHSRHLLMSGRV